MRLTDLEPQFVRYETGPHPSQRFDDGSPMHDMKVLEATGLTSEYLHHVDSLAEAQGIQFLCPVCFVRNGGAVGTHRIEVSFSGRGVRDHQGSHNREGKPSRWDVSGGAAYDDLSLLPSILIDPAKPACDGWHGYITNGAAK